MKKATKFLIVLISVFSFALFALRVEATETDIVYFEDFEENSSKIILGESLVDGATGWYGNATPTVESENVINGSKSLRVWVNDIGAWKKIFAIELPSNLVGTETYYTIIFKYRWKSENPTLFGTVKFDKSLFGIGFDGGLAGSTDGIADGINQNHIINIGSEGKYLSKDLGNGIRNACVLMKSSTEDSMIFFAAGDYGAEYVIDDLQVYVGDHFDKMDDNIELNVFKLGQVSHVYQFEESVDGYNPVDSKISFEKANPISGKGSLRVDFSNINALNNVMAKIGIGDYLKENTYYTLQFKIRVQNVKQIMVIPYTDVANGSSARAEFCYDFISEQQIKCYGADNFTYQYFADKDYYLFSFSFYSILGGYYDLWKAESAGDDSYIVLDDIMMYEGPNLANPSEYPKITFAGVRYDSGYVNYNIKLPNCLTENIKDQVGIKVVYPSGKEDLISFNERNFTPNEVGKYKVVYYGYSNNGLFASTSFYIDILPIPADPTITIDEKYVKVLEESYINQIIILPSVEFTDDEDKLIEIEIIGPNGFYAAEYNILPKEAGEYIVTYTAVNGVGVVTTESFSFVVKAEKDEENVDNNFSILDENGQIINSGYQESQNLLDADTTDNTLLVILISIGIVLAVGAVVLVVIIRKRRGLK